MTDQPTTTDRAAAVAAWTLHYEADRNRAHARIAHMKQHGIPEGHTAEWLGANLSLVPQADRCEHFGDRTYCTQCQIEQWQAEDQAKGERREQRRTSAARGRGREVRIVTFSARPRGRSA
jgi:hypothetical protein